MLADFFLHINWLYILMVAILVRIIYIGVINGFVVEFFKLLGIFFSCLVCFHYYGIIADAVHNRIPLFSLTTWQIFYFVVLWGVMAAIFAFIREGMLLLFKVDAHPVLDQWVGAVVAIGRGIVVCSLVTYALVISDFKFMEKMPERSFAKKVVFPIAPNIYSFTFNKFIGKLFPDEQINMQVVALVKSRGKKPH